MPTGRRALVLCVTAGLISALLFGAPSTALAGDVPPPAGRTAATVDPAVSSAVDHGPVPVIVELSGGRPTGPADGAAAEVRRRTEELDAAVPGLRDGVRPLDDLPLATTTVDAASLEALRHTPGVTRITRNQQRHTALSQSVPLIGAPALWGAGTDGAGQTIALLDTGVDRNHPFLAGKVLAEACFSSSVFGSTAICPGADPTTATGTGAAAPCSVSNECFHGTHVAGIAVGGTGTGFSGVAPGATLLAVQVFSVLTSPQDCSPYAAPCTTAWDSDIVRALNWVYGQRNTYSIAAVNLSLAGPASTPDCSSEAEQAPIAALRSAGIVTVAASGNESNKSTLDAPACIPGAVSVGASSDTSDTAMSFSNSAPGLSLLAPGSVITSSAPSGTSFGGPCPAPFAAATCVSAQGTSMAAPHVAGAFALLRQLRPTFTVTDDLSLLRSTGVPVLDPANGVATPRVALDTAARPPGYHALTPSRLLDTRSGLGTSGPGPIGAGSTLDLQVTGRGGVPSTGVRAVVLNVTYVNPSDTSFVTVWPTGFTRPLASNLNLDPGGTRANLVTAAIGAGGKVSLFNNSGSTQLVADVAGWYDAGGAATGGTHLRSVTPVRAFDTRSGTGGVPVAKVAGGSTITVDPSALCGFSGASAAVLNVTATDATAPTHITVWPADQTRPTASNLNLGAGTTVPNLVIVKLGVGGVKLFNNSGAVNLLADLAGCFDDGSSTGGRFVPLSPARLLDTRNGTGTGSSAPIGTAASVDLQVTGRGGVPSSGVSAVVLNVTGTQPSADTHVTAWPTGQSMPLASNLNLATGATAPNLVVVKVGTGGKVSLFNNAGSTHLIADVAGWYTS